MLHIILSLSQREVETQSETYQPTNKTPNEEQTKLLVTAEIYFPPEIKNMNTLAYTINISFVKCKSIENLGNIKRWQRCFSVSPVLHLLASGGEKDAIDQPNCCATFIYQ